MRVLLAHIFFVLGLVVAGCTGPAVRSELIAEPRAPKSTFSPVAVYRIYEDPPDTARTLGVVSVQDTGLSVNCGFSQVVDIARDEARKMGGNAVHLKSENPPDFISTCYRIEAFVLEIPAGGSTITDREEATSAGTGFFVDANGTFITANHVIKSRDKIDVKCIDQEWRPAKLIKASKSTDLAVLKVDGEKAIEYLPVAGSETIEVGERAYTIGYPVVQILGSEPKYTDGSISALSGIQGEQSLLQISVSIQPGNSGGPLLDEQGRVIGVVVSSAAVRSFFAATETLPQNVNWAVKSDYIVAILGSEFLLDERSTRTVNQVREAVCVVRSG